MKRNIIIGDTPLQPAEQTNTQDSSRNDTSKLNPDAPSKLRQFLFKTWKPQFGWKYYILLYFCLGVIILFYAKFLSKLNSGVDEFKVQYDNLCGLTADCTVSVNISTSLKQPVYLYYGVDDMYQNFRYYLRSKNANQLAGKDITFTQANTSCYPAVTNADIGKTVSWGGKTLDPTAIASPCGMIAKSFFTDKFELWKDTTNITLTDKNIAFPYTVGTKYKRIENSADLQWTDPENEHFIVWMNIASHSDFRKLYARIDQDLDAGIYQVKINNLYNVNDFGGAKHVIISTASAMGSKNNVTPFIFYVIGILFLGISVYLAIKWRMAISEAKFTNHKIIILDK